MADIAFSPNRKRKVLSIRVDLTPMVDLGFLLITFFIFTTTLHEATAMKLILPKDDPAAPVTPTAASKTLNLVLAGHDQLWSYTGEAIQQARLISFRELRTTISNNRIAVGERWKDLNELVVLIKPTADASYKNIVDALDEMTIGAVKRYVLMEPSSEEKLLHQ